MTGVGPGDHLSEHGIPVHRDLPVGHNLQDHYGTGALTFTLSQPVSLVQTRYENIPAVLKYAIFGSGPLTVLGGVEVRIIAISSIPRSALKFKIQFLMLYTSIDLPQKQDITFIKHVLPNFKFCSQIIIMKTRDIAN